ncbi:PAS domain-containing protein [Desulfuromonas sp. DDH964]|uniref:PAS domain S-box protein n=1 Tax=Desulfuromonas sp. DDH964 TaxID=1823759 RepID=UPI00078B73EA|nr:PAS domain S-box protein [Desulfuromonas sp. DDH964]AMV72886.1 PAS domain-containing protein [Desulfuromonas sp. DDH964]
MPETLPLTVYQEIIDQAPDAVLLADREGKIRLWNRGAELLFGFSAAEALGQSLDLIIPERLRGRHWDGYHRVMASGETRYGTDLLAVPAQHRDGRKLSCEFSIVMLKDNAGKVLGIASLMRDATARWQKEKELLARIAELEQATRG